MCDHEIQMRSTFVVDNVSPEKTVWKISCTLKTPFLFAQQKYIEVFSPANMEQKTKASK